MYYYYHTAVVSIYVLIVRCVQRAFRGPEFRTLSRTHYVRRSQDAGFQVAVDCCRWRTHVVNAHCCKIVPTDFVVQFHYDWDGLH